MNTTRVYDTFWRFAAARQDAYVRRQKDAYVSRQQGDAPYTSDPIIAKYRFTNCYRVADRVSQYLLYYVAPPTTTILSPQEQVFRILLFKVFNKIETWEGIVDRVGEPLFSRFSYVWAAVEAMHARKETLYSAAYMMPQPDYGAQGKWANHLSWLHYFCCNGGPYLQLLSATSMQSAFSVLRAQRGLGDFLAFQFLIDLNYTPLLNFDENDFIVPGPGALDGISKCFDGKVDPVQAIVYVTANQDREFAARGLNFQYLAGRRLHLIDCQNLFCEVDKYARVAHPDVATRRTKIKQSYKPSPRPPLPLMLPLKWVTR